MAADSSIWSCLTCRLCENVCPADIPYSRLNKKVRSISREMGVEKTCTHGGVFEQISELMTRPDIQQNRLAWVTDNVKIKNDKTDTLFFTGCSPYFAAYFGEPYSEKLTGSLRSAVRLMNRIGIEPMLLPNELCCGHDLLLRGETEKFENLAVKVNKQIKDSGAKRVVFSCPECLVTFRDDYKNLFGKLDYETIHLSELIQPELDKLDFSSDENSYTYQDPCRLGRYSGLYDQPREILNSVPGIDFKEMPHNKERSLCCGNTAWIGCDSGTKTLQTQRLQEAVNTNCENLLTACPKCLIHLTCSQQGDKESPINSLKINDIWNFVESHLQ